MGWVSIPVTPKSNPNPAKIGSREEWLRVLIVLIISTIFRLQNPMQNFLMEIKRTARHHEDKRVAQKLMTSKGILFTFSAQYTRYRLSDYEGF
jgi:hypothetical protein